MRLDRCLAKSCFAKGRPDEDPEPWRQFHAEGCHGKIEGIAGPPRVRRTSIQMPIFSSSEPWRRFRPLGCQRKIEGISANDVEVQARKIDGTDELAQSAEVEHITSYKAGTGHLTLAVHTMGGQELLISGCVACTSLGEVKQILQEMLSTSHNELRLVCAGEVLDRGELWSEQSIAEAGLDGPDALLLVIRTQSHEKLSKMFMDACESSNDVAARELIDRGAGFDQDGKPILCMGSTMLHLAIRARLEDLAQYLIQSGADIHAENEKGRQPLSVAAMKGLGRIVVSLLEAGADSHHHDQIGYSAIYYASTSCAKRWAEQNGSLHELRRLTDGAPGH